MLLIFPSRRAPRADSHCVSGARLAVRAALSLALLAPAACRTVAPAVPFTEQPWTYGGCDGRRLVTDHFDLYTTVADARLVDALPAFLEAAYREYDALVPLRPPTEVRLTTYLFGSRLEWDRFVQANYPARHEVYARIRSGGFTEGGTAVIFHKAPPTTLATLAHEGWHQYADSLPGPAIPAWLNEGLGCTFEGFEFVRGRPRFTPLRNTFRINFLREGLMQGSLLELPQLLELDAGEMLTRDDSRLTQTYYAQTWALIAFFRHGERGAAGGGRAAGPGAGGDGDADGAGGGPAASRRLDEGFQRMMDDLRDGVLHVHLSATRLAAPQSGHEAASFSDGRALFEAYFGPCDEGMARDYKAYLLALTALDRRAVTPATSNAGASVAAYRPGRP